MIFDHATPRWFTIPANRPFLDDLAAGLMAALPGPEDLPGALLLTPTRRGARGLAEAFVGAGGGRPVLLPQIRALGDLDEGEPPFEPGDVALDLPPAITPLRRRFELAGLLHTIEPGFTAGHALDLADALAGFLDSAAIEEADLDGRLSGLVDLELADHWRISADLLEAVVARWPARLAGLGLMDVGERRVALLRRLAEHWDETRPVTPILAAGSTGTAPATAALLAVIGKLERGAVILPGLDQDLAEAAWNGIEDQHPQASLRYLLGRAGVTRQQVQVWRADADMKGRWRRRLVNEALRPADATADWLKVIDDLRREAPAGVDPFAAGLEGLSSITARNEDEAAAVCALLLRETLEQPGRTCALVTPDQALARRVSARLARWGLAADSTAGVRLSLTPVGALTLALAGLVADPADPVARLRVLKSPLVTLGRDPETLEADRQALEAWGLRGARPLSQAALEERLGAVAAEHSRLIEAMAGAVALSRDLEAVVVALTAPFADGAACATQATSALSAALEALAPGEALAWSGPEGEALARLLAEVIAHGEALPPLSPLGFEVLVRQLLSEETVRGDETAHPRLRIMGALEARLTRADRLILAGLEEGVWPRPAAIDPFLSRPMRKALGLPSPERRIGLSAHDFAQGACAPEVFLVDSARHDGAPATPSRWLWRLRTLARGAGLELPGRPELLAWAAALDAGGEYAPVRRPSPKPPVSDRPRKMSVTRIETLTRDPYAVWARDILRLYPLDRPDQRIEAMARGTAIHGAFEGLALAWNRAGREPENAVAFFEDCYLEALARQGVGAAALRRERALARETALWVVDFERRRRADGRAIHVEIGGAMTLMAGGVPHELTARTDRLEVTTGGVGHILDFKTGAPPSVKMIDTGFAPQLTLTGAILRDGGFRDLGGAGLIPGDLTYVRITGRDPAGEEITPKAAGPDSEEAVAIAIEGTRALLAAYLDPDRGYTSRTAPQFVKAYAGDYDHLARVFEWSTGGEEDGA
ncbi:MAG: double-strand break repair protein AddB [Caulobacter sp.]